MSLARLVVVELGVTLRLSYVVISELLPRFRVAMGMTVPHFTTDAYAQEFYVKAADSNYVSFFITCTVTF